MKKINLTMFVLICMGLVFMLPSCSSDDDVDLEKQEQEKYAEFVTPEIEASLTKLGMPVYRGINPPQIEGYYRVNRMKFIATTNSAENIYLGGYFATDFKFNYYDQKDLSISLIGYEVQRDTDIIETVHEGEGTFITGYDNLFSIFIEESVTFEDKEGTAKVLTVFSGEIEKSDEGVITGLKDFRYAYLMKDNGGVSGLMSEGYGRVIKGDEAIILTKEEFETLEEATKSSRSVVATAGSVLSSLN